MVALGTSNVIEGFNFKSSNREWYGDITVLKVIFFPLELLCGMDWKYENQFQEYNS